MPRPIRIKKHGAGTGEPVHVGNVPAETRNTRPRKTAQTPDLNARYPEIASRLAATGNANTSFNSLTQPKKAPKEGAIGDDFPPPDEPQEPTPPERQQPNPAEPLEHQQREAYSQHRAQGVERYRAYLLATRSGAKKGTASAQASEWERRPEVSARISYLTAAATRKLGQSDIRRRYMDALSEMMLSGSETTPAERLKAGSEYAKLAGWYDESWKEDGTVSPETLDPAAFVQTIAKAEKLFGTVESLRAELLKSVEKHGNSAHPESVTCCDPADYAAYGRDTESRARPGVNDEHAHAPAHAPAREPDPPPPAQLFAHNASPYQR